MFVEYEKYTLLREEMSRREMIAEDVGIRQWESRISDTLFIKFLCQAIRENLISLSDLESFKNYQKDLESYLLHYEMYKILGANNMKSNIYLGNYSQLELTYYPLATICYEQKIELFENAYLQEIFLLDRELFPDISTHLDHLSKISQLGLEIEQYFSEFILDKALSLEDYMTNMEKYKSMLPSKSNNWYCNTRKNIPILIKIIEKSLIQEKITKSSMIFYK